MILDSQAIIEALRKPFNKLDLWESPWDATITLIIPKYIEYLAENCSRGHRLPEIYCTPEVDVEVDVLRIRATFE